MAYHLIAISKRRGNPRAPTLLMTGSAADCATRASHLGKSTQLTAMECVQLETPTARSTDWDYYIVTGLDEPRHPINFKV